MLQTSNSSNFVITIELRYLEFINFTHEDGESQDADNVAIEEEHNDEFIHDTDILEDEILEDYTDEELLDKNKDETTDEEDNVDHIYSYTK